MERLNYHHLYYFWVVATEGTITAACNLLHVAQPTISTQLRALEKELGKQLFIRAGRHLQLTDAGHTVYRYADSIFALGQEMTSALESTRGRGRHLVNIGIADVLPKLVVYRLLAPVFTLEQSVRLVCHEAPATELLGRLATQELDLVLTDSPIGPEINVRAATHLMGKCGVSIVGAKNLATDLRKETFPKSLDMAPFLFPTRNTTLRFGLDEWFTTEQISPMVVAEIADSALLKSFGQAGAGMFAVPDIVEEEVVRQYNVRVVGRVPTVEERFFGIFLDEKQISPAVAAILDAAAEK
jgi:LysR family transcriptional activator of nhaA